MVRISAKIASLVKTLKKSALPYKRTQLITRRYRCKYCKQSVATRFDTLSSNIFYKENIVPVHQNKTLEHNYTSLPNSPSSPKSIHVSYCLIEIVDGKLSHLSPLSMQFFCSKFAKIFYSYSFQGERHTYRKDCSQERNGLWTKINRCGLKMFRRKAWTMPLTSSK